MVNLGYKGFEGLIDLPGTIGAGIYGNAGCYNCLLSDSLIKIDLISEEGVLYSLDKKDLGFITRSSALKRGELSGLILYAYFLLEKGDIYEIKKAAEQNAINRKQSSPAKNLGSTYYNLNNRTVLGILIEKIGGIYSRLLNLSGLNAAEIKRQRLNLEISLAGGKSAIPYLFSMNRFIWVDEGADSAFIKYQQAIRKIFKDPHLEIEIFE